MGRRKRKRKMKHLQQALGKGETSKHRASHMSGRRKRGGDFERRFCQAESPQVSCYPTLRTFMPSQGCHQGLPSVPLLSHRDHGGWDCPQGHAGAAGFRQESTALRAMGTPRWHVGCPKESPVPDNCISSPFNFAQYNSSVVRHSLSPSMVYLKQS